MDFKTAVIRCLRDKYVDFNGRAGYVRADPAHLSGGAG